LLKDKQIIIVHGRRREAYLLSKALWSLYKSLKEWRHPYFIGLYLGEIHEKTLQPSLHMCHKLSAATISRTAVIVTPQGEQKFLYGKSLESDHLKKHPEEVSDDLEVLVLNQKGEALGFGLLEQGIGGEMKLSNLRDLGWYLRRGG
jgi:ribosome biogenesis protein Nip4